MLRHSFVLLVTATLLPLSCRGGGGGGEAPSLLDEIPRRGVMRVGVECVYKGTCFVDPETGEAVGYSVELTNLMARDLGVTVEWVDLEWTALIPAITTGNVDIVTQGMTNTPERAKVVEMTRPMDYYPGVLILPADSPLHDQATLDELLAVLNTPERTVSFLLGGSQERTANALFPEATHRALDVAAAYMELVSGRADAMIADASDAWDMTRENPAGKIWRDQIVYSLYGCMVIRAGDQRFLNWLNNWIDYYTSNQTLWNVKLKWYRERGVPDWMQVLPPSLD